MRVPFWLDFLNFFSFFIPPCSLAGIRFAACTFSVAATVEGHLSPDRLFSVDMSDSSHSLFVSHLWVMVALQHFASHTWGPVAQHRAFFLIPPLVLFCVSFLPFLYVLVVPLFPLPCFLFKGTGELPIPSVFEDTSDSIPFHSEIGSSRLFLFVVLW